MGFETCDNSSVRNWSRGMLTICFHFPRVCWHRCPYFVQMRLCAGKRSGDSNSLSIRAIATVQKRRGHDDLRRMKFRRELLLLLDNREAFLECSANPFHASETSPLIFNGWIWDKTSSSFFMARYRSHLSCKFSQKSSDVPKNLARRNAVLGVIPLLPLMISFTL